MKIIRDFLLKKITSTAIGGPAEFYAEAKNEADLSDAINWAAENGRKYFLTGDGTNLIPSDGGFAGLIIRNQIKKFAVNGDIVFLGAGNNLFSSIRRLNRLGLAGMEKMAGIPGTVGGAIYGCAGAYGQEVRDRLIRVKVFDAKMSGFKWLSNGECRFGYRDSIFKKHPEWIIVASEFRLTKGNPKVLQKTSAEIVRIRSRKYPPGLKCPGSFFKNIVVSQIKPASFRKRFLAKIDQGKINHGKLPTAHLLEQIGAKGMKKGGIAVTDYHANLIYNTGGGKSKDMRALAELLKKRVKKKFGVELEEEIRYLG